MRGETRTFFEVTFLDYAGNAHRLDTMDPAKIGPWLAEMYMLWPYMASAPTQVRIHTYAVPLPGA